MKVLILVWGSANRGKTQSIRELASSFKYDPIFHEWDKNSNDSYVIGTIKDKEHKDRIIGIESLGDPIYEETQVEWISECVKKGCEVIVAASRSYGVTYNNAVGIAYDNGYEVIELTTYYHEGGPILSNRLDLNKTLARNLKGLVMKCLEL